MKQLDDFERLSLGFFPTPLETLPQLSAQLGIKLSIKRDDYTGFGGGGNKVRKLEYLMAEARRENVDVVITTGGHQSNHARMVAAAARRFGMKPVAFSGTSNSEPRFSAGARHCVVSGIGICGD